MTVTIAIPNDNIPFLDACNVYFNYNKIKTTPIKIHATPTEIFHIRINLYDDKNFPEDDIDPDVSTQYSSPRRNYNHRHVATSPYYRDGGFYDHHAHIRGTTSNYLHSGHWTTYRDNIGAIGGCSWESSWF
ncbi:hypothetical protein RhiirC2_803565 [Rhizophagus irregularis]|uniref:Uncharacterized protein n=1 Tax=Rhizophagus irregularis TaxID=588596 RepID=A0A2N1LFY8_9GLOM|nr:hypothetical protein RhiirC2_803565 [Rhizophagus irregularis]